ncbi:TIGR04283 family arsenosugar biosynthesis glycosyltransferase [Oscillatoria sp. FACHB-1407]|uniref:TIGR04283 family arsenosugar biosynthesis glycosyltransferase n=1 Tax=Oscillatoria sp. FACHB-1407 TaxID=2692847 RepID=UPI001688C5B4|nr:TIGR04283 family arsenosugar biosynthesis glycosyltransferase [Oscillatoria sp. FACHB-1407]MBD2460151.1 TIGR04283 family arsenosugar biosynthesis glycosyltransferase [Oscillatoria sp. FACHB-1407]
MQHLLVFTRYPEPGKTKTRLIPALGAEAAADLQRQMTEHAIAQIRILQTTHPTLTVTVWFAGGDADREADYRSLLQDWLGSDLDYRPQSKGDLGARLSWASQTAFAAGATEIVIIGTDCPGVDAERLAQAFAALCISDGVLGPATDGGYYLIGLRVADAPPDQSREDRFSRLIPALFSDVAWGTSDVFRQTVAIAQALNLTLAYLQPLTDIDRPEDVAVWEAIRDGKPAQVTPHDRISVIIPVLNEADKIAKTLQHLKAVPQVEAIVVDGGSQDDTVAVAQAYGAIVLQTPPGRAHQMNTGATVATGSVLLFLHADSQLPQRFVEQIHQTLAQPNVVLGAFNLAIDSSIPGLRLVEWGVKWRSLLLQLPYGDQALFLKATQFQQVGGFAELPIMEDFDFVRRLQHLGRVAIAPASVVTSARRWEKLGVLRTTLINQFIIMTYFLGVRRDRIARWYRSGMKKKG